MNGDVKTWISTTCALLMKQGGISFYQKKIYTVYHTNTYMCKFSNKNTTIWSRQRGEMFFYHANYWGSPYGIILYK
jgi:hypothetical protein